MVFVLGEVFEADLGEAAVEEVLAVVVAEEVVLALAVLVRKEVGWVVVLEEAVWTRRRDS